uniref:KIB1-4 beta-propeller domain-containing protein n=1 Tax=Oryza sativa subsp. japonica TaxID=39947 RepID=Q6AUM7_ORYSJ|nr:hypothetical protein [Oryza sativa Japonica Group]
MAEESSPFDEVPAYVLYEIARHIPCKVDRVRALVVNCSWRTSLQALPPPPLPPQLPWLLRPSAGGPTFSCLLSGADELSVHRVRVPADLRGARYFGSYDGGWLFLASGQTFGHMLFNIRTEQRLFLPDTVTQPWRSDDFPMIMLAATVSSPPSAKDDLCFGAAIVSDVGQKLAQRCNVFWELGDCRAVSFVPPQDPFNLFFEMEDVIYYQGAFNFLSIWRNVLECRLTLHQGVLQVHQKWRLFLPQEELSLCRNAAARYLVESRGQLLMVIRERPAYNQSREFFIFDMTKTEEAVDEAEYIWRRMPELDGRMLFVGHGCSRSYEVGDFPGFQEGIYFFDDQDSYSVSSIAEDNEYTCFDNGKWSAGPPLMETYCFWPDQVNSNYSSPVWLLPGEYLFDVSRCFHLLLFHGHGLRPDGHVRGLAGGGQGPRTGARLTPVIPVTVKAKAVVAGPGKLFTQNGNLNAAKIHQASASGPGSCFNRKQSE